MARPWRIQFPDAVYHVSSRGNHRQLIFLDDDDRHAFLHLIGEASTRFRLEIFAFCLMSNHYHLFLRTPEPNLAAVMHWLNGTYTARFNRRHRQIGHLFQGRYRAVVVTEESHWLHLSMYLHLNPVRAKMVDDPSDYLWSSFRDYYRTKSRFSWLKPGAILESYGQTAAGRSRRYRQECLGLAATAPDFGKDFRSKSFLGPKEKLEKLARRYRPSGRVEAVPDFQRTRRREVEIGQELGRVAEAFKVKPEELFQRRRNHRARLAAYYHLVVNCRVQVTEAGNLMKVGAPAISLGIRSLKASMEKDLKLRETVMGLTKI